MDMKKTIALLFVALAIIVLSVSCNLDPVKDQQYSYITFSSDATFTITPSYNGNKPVWDGTLQYSTVLNNPEAWVSFNSKKNPSATAGQSGDEFVLYVRGVDNTRVSALDNGWTIQSTSDVGCTGNIMSLLNCLDVNSASISANCFASMFEGWTNLVSVPTLYYGSLPSGCYCNMFKNCTSLSIEAVPDNTSPQNWWVEKIISIPSSYQGGSAFTGMFDGCSPSSIGPVSNVTSGYTYCYFSTEEPERPYLMFVSDSYYSLKIQLRYTLLEFSSDVFHDGWTAYSKNTTIQSKFDSTLNKYVIYLRGKNTAVNSNNGTQKSFNVSQNVVIDCIGNVMTLLDYEDPDNAVMAENCFGNLFNMFSQLRTAPSLPATELVKLCYNCMFAECTSLQQAPALPATVLAESCYSNMFRKCSSLTVPPELPATELAEGCYYNMFCDCYGLTCCTELPATILPESCYSNMFHSCSSLKIEEVQHGGTPTQANVQNFIFTAQASGCQYMFSCCDTYNSIAQNVYSMPQAGYDYYWF